VVPLDPSLDSPVHLDVVLSRRGKRLSNEVTVRRVMSSAWSLWSAASVSEWSVCLSASGEL